VTKVQRLKAWVKHECEPFDAGDPIKDKQLGEDALWNHHVVYQDAVNYYTLALVALGAGLTGCRRTMNGAVRLGLAKPRVRCGWSCRAQSRVSSPINSRGALRRPLYRASALSQRDWDTNSMPSELVHWTGLSVSLGWSGGGFGRLTESELAPSISR